MSGTVAPDLTGRQFRRTGTLVSVNDGASSGLPDTEPMLELLARALPLALFVTDPAGRLRYTSPMWEEVTGAPPDAPGARSLLALAYPSDREHVESALARATATGQPRALEMRVVLEDGAVRRVAGGLAPDVDDDGRVRGLVGYLESNREAAEDREAGARLAAVVEMTSDVVGITDEDGRIVYMNDAGRRRLGIVGRDLSTLTTADIFTPVMFERYYDEIRPRLVRGESWTGEVEMLDAAGIPIPMWISVVAGSGPGGEIEWLATIARDVTERRAHEIELSRRAGHDPLTGLPNRSHLIEHLELALARGARRGENVGVLFLDLDRFKAVNDRLGHDAGDEVLRETARRIQGALRPGDVVARLGGDEFVVVCDDAGSPGDLLVVAGRVFEAVAAPPYPLGVQGVALTASLGAALGTPSMTSEEVLRAADSAMYHAKHRGRARIEMFDEAEPGPLIGREAMVHDLDVAVAQVQIQVLYQPVVDLVRSTTVGLEALARWEHPERGIIGDEELATLADDAGLAMPMRLQILRRACRQARAWEQHLGARIPRLHVDSPMSLLGDGSFVELVLEVLTDTGLDASRLCVEVPEEAFGSRAGEALPTIHRLRHLGVGVAVDDFGAGPSSLGTLRGAGVDMLKISSGFVAELSSPSGDDAVVHAAVSVAHAMEVWAVAEGVETSVQRDALRDLECDAGQGGLFAPPVPASGARGLLVRHFA